MQDIVVSSVQEHKGIGNNSDSVREFFAALFDPTDLVEIRLVGGGRTDTHWQQAGRIGAEAARYFDECAQIGGHSGVYFGVAPRPEEWKRKRDDIRIVRTLFVDFDTTDLTAVRTSLAKLPVPTAIVQTGGGYHVYWRLTEPIKLEAEADRRRMEGLLTGIIQTVGSDPADSDIPRILRLPGTFNRKAKYPQPRPVEVMELSGLRHDVSLFPMAQIEAADEEETDDDPSTPWGDFNIRAKWEEILEPKGWDQVDAVRWRRPGATTPHSASVGGPRNTLYVFSSNAAPFEPNHAYTKFKAYALMHHDGDSSAAASELLRKGYGEGLSPKLLAEEAEAEAIVGAKGASEPVKADPATAAMAAELGVSPSQLTGASEKKGKSKDRRRFEDANALLSLPDPEWLIEGIMVENSFAMVYGLPGCYKTFFAIDAALSLAHGLPFVGHFGVGEPIAVGYISPEGTLGIKKRLRSFMAEYGLDRLRNLVFNRNAFRLNDTEEVEAVVRQVTETGTAIKLLVIDTLARNFGGGDENSTKDMNAFVNNVMDIAARLGIAVLVVHHCGKDSAKGARGSIALTGACDLSIEMSKSEDGKTVTVRCRKQKDFEEFKPFVLRPKIVGQSIVLKYDGEASAETESTKAVNVSDLMPVLKALPGDESAAAALGDICPKLDLAKTTIYRHLDLAVRQGLAIKTDNKRYYLTPTGQAKVIADKLGVD